MKIAYWLMPALVIALFPSVGVTRLLAQDPPGRVVRVSYLQGGVSFRPDDAEDWTDAPLNYPLTSGDELWTDADSRAEVTLGSAAIRLAPYTAFTFLALDDEVTQIRLTQGTVYVRVRRLGGDETFEIDTPTGAVSLLQPGAYRVDVDPSGETTTATVRDGEAEVVSAGSSFSVQRGQAATVTGVDRPTYDVSDASPPDAWEGWSVARDRRMEGSRSARYVSEDMPGYEDLDDNGDWRDTPDYGAVWAPRVAAGWAPYRDGHWAWVDPWGWTWIDDAPWGFAPFHYGRWVNVGGGWAWAPGRIVARPVYAPALVVFVGGSNWNVAIGGGYGWFPLAPDEVYIPAYHVSEQYARRVNETSVNITIINVTNVDVSRARYRNRDVNDGVTVVTSATFVGARPVAQGRIAVPRDRMGNAGILGMAIPLAPTRESVVARRSQGVAKRPPDAVTRRVVVTHRTPPPPPVPFSVKQQVLSEHPGRPVDAATLSTLRGRTPRGETKQLERSAVTVAAGQELKPARSGVTAARPARASADRGRRQQPEPAQPAGEVRRQPTPAPEPAQPARPQPAQPPAEPRGNQRPQPDRPSQRERDAGRQPTPAPERPQPAQPQPAQPSAEPRGEPAQRQQPDRPPQRERGERRQPAQAPERPQPNQPPAASRPDTAQRQQPEQRPQPDRPSQRGAGGRREPTPAPERQQPAQPAAEARDSARQQQPARPAQGRNQGKDQGKEQGKNQGKNQEKDSSETRRRND